jgi:hypothetical protein
MTVGEWRINRQDEVVSGKNSLYEYRVVSHSWCLTNKSIARKIESILNESSQQGWKLAWLSSVTVLGTNIGFNLVLERELGPEGGASAHVSNYTLSNLK